MGSRTSLNTPISVLRMARIAAPTHLDSHLPVTITMARAAVEDPPAPSLPSARMTQRRQMISTSMMDWRMMTLRLQLALIRVLRPTPHEPNQFHLSPILFVLCPSPSSFGQVRIISLFYNCLSSQFLFLLFSLGDSNGLNNGALLSFFQHHFIPFLSSFFLDCFYSLRTFLLPIHNSLRSPLNTAFEAYLNLSPQLLFPFLTSLSLPLTCSSCLSAFIVLITYLFA